MIDTLIVLAKQPRPGLVKTRLCPPFTAVQAAELAAAALRDTLDAIAATPARRRLLVLDGDPAGWVPDGWTHEPQVPGPFAGRMAAAFAHAGRASAALVAMDTPQLTPDLFAPFDPALDDACLGRTRDGGYWTLGLGDASWAPRVLHGIPMSTAHTADAQQRRLAELGLTTRLLAPLVDVDTAADAADVAAAAPGTAFARAHALALRAEAS